MPRSLRIMHVDAERGFSGGEVQVFLLMRGLAQRGHANLLVTPPASGAERVARERGIAVATVPMRSDADLAAVWRLSRLLRTSGVDLVHLHTGRAAWLGGLAATWTGVPALITRRMDRPVRPGWRTRFLYQRAARRSAAISRAVADCLIAGGVPPARLTIIPSAVDAERVRPQRGRAALRDELGAPPDACVLLALAGLERRKGIDVLLRAATMLQAAGVGPHLWVAGDGPERDALHAEARGAGLDTVRFLGRREDVGDLLAGCDVFVLPSRREGLGVAALEAMAAARPVVASAVGGLADAVLDGRTGLLVPPDDAAALAAALRRLIEDGNWRARLGAAGQARVADGHLPEQMVDAYERLYSEILAP